MLKIVLIAAGIAVLGLFPLIGIPGACVLYIGSPVINLFYGTLAFEAWMRTLGSGAWPLAIGLSLIWPITIPIAFFLSNRWLPSLQLFSFQKFSTFLCLVTIGCVVIGVTSVLLSNRVKRLSDAELLVEATYAGKLKIVKKVESRVKDTELTPTEDPLYIAISAKKSELAEHFVGRRSNLDSYLDGTSDNGSNHSKSPLHTAIQVGLIKTAELMLEKKANPNVRDRAGMTPAFEVSWSSTHDGAELKLLKKYGADFSAVDLEGNTIISVFAQRLNRWEQLKINTEILIEGGADGQIKNNLGKTALDYAKENSHAEIFDLLK